MVLNFISFYAKAGRQIFKMDVLRCCTVIVFVGDAKIYDNFVLNLGGVVAGDALRVDEKTHVFNHVLREMLVISPLSNNNNNNNSTINHK